ncbi:4Fe-4S dicluster domain-containing protein [Paracoccus sp. S-4012]|uniref:4Fe-4S dicluster domain-containing protein n=1 Tax=Paracoccus sp. S-4012 TaxID=2665648 RepID=UPI0012AEE643|nr:4Fe-4S dicluster domain-containing protein [Paracoccus sp. S-4012]
MSAPGHTRREALRLFSAGTAALVAGCRAPARPIVPYRDMPEGLVEGKPLFFATTLPLAGAGRGVLVESHEGRPTKVHGNPLHPASLGATDVFAEAAVLGLFDPARSRAPLRGGQPVGWGALAQALGAVAARDGAALVTGPVGSAAMAGQIADLLARHPGMRWFMHRTVTPALEVSGVQVWPDFDSLDAIVTIGADPLGPGPAQIALAKGWSRARRERGLRSHAFDSGPTLTSARADRRMSLRPSALPGIAGALLAMLQGGTAASGPVAEAAAILRAAGPGRAAVLGDAPAASGTIARINALLDAPIRHLRPFWQWPGLAPAPMPELMAEMEAGRVPALVLLGVNPVYDLGNAFAAAMAQVPERLHFGTEADETAAACDWHGPLHHPLEDWSDLRAVDGTQALVQPLIAPLHDSRSGYEVLAMMLGPEPGSAFEILRGTWAARWGDAVEERWRQSLHDGVIEGTAAEVLAGPPDVADAAAPLVEAGGFELTQRPSPSVLDGSFAANAWLQETPDPFTKQVWGSAAWLAPSDAQALGIADGDLVELHSDGQGARLPAIVVPGQAEGCITVHRGYGRVAAGPIGSGVGTRVAGLGTTATLRATGSRAEPARLQADMNQHGRNILPTTATLAPTGPPPPSFYTQPRDGNLAWGMVIDTDACIGCNACITACQSENNIPVVGPDETRRGRHMHWMRVDAYLMEDGGHGFQPVPCMHCEHAPCEPVCPVEASVHDSEGLNVQVYNRCIGTRFCQANCPYKVRRFNFFDYADRQAFENQGADLLQALRNPDVTVRARGVMEKCTYCVQRISAARRDAKKENRPVAEGEVVTACQSACPADAITFGNLADPASAVNRAKADPRHYALLEDLGTRPRTTYLARRVPDGKEGA